MNELVACISALTIADQKPLTISAINARIRDEICINSINQLKDENLINEYKQTKSVRAEILKLNNILASHKIDETTRNSIIAEYIAELIPPGTKGAIRGVKFNTIVKQFISSLNLDPNVFEIAFEKKPTNVTISEIPDWYILNKSNNRLLIGMNQLDLWSGGQQINRGYKYIVDGFGQTAPNQYKLICVVCNDITIKSDKNKVYRLFDVGFRNNALCFLRGLKNIINRYFD